MIEAKYGAGEPYQWLMANVQGCGYLPENVGPASVDLTIMARVLCWCYPPWIARVLLSIFPQLVRWYHPNAKIHRVANARLVVAWETSCEAGLMLLPGYFYLLSTQESIRVPATHQAFVLLRSSAARSGMQHAQAGYADPGFHGQITLEIHTTLPVRIQAGQRLVQILYQRLTEATRRPYVGKYNGQHGPTQQYPQWAADKNEEGGHGCV